MLRAHRYSLLVSLLFTAAACTQAPAQVDLKGQNLYSRDTVSGYASANSGNNSANDYHASSYSNVNTHTESSAKVQSIGVNDLSPPTGAVPANNKGAQNTPQNASPFKPAATVAAKETPKPIITANINPWTHTPRTNTATDALDESFNLRPQGKPAGAAKEQMVSEVKKPADEAKMAKLDTIIGSEGDASVKKNVGITKSAKPDVVASASGFMWPVNSKKIISEFGPKGKGKVNDGINIASADGEPVWAAADGEVVYVGNELQGYGNMVLIKHSGNKTTSYAHLNRATVDKYDRIKQGDIIGYVGSTGNVREPQLHFAIREGKDPVDPLRYLNNKVASAQ